MKVREVESICQQLADAKGKVYAKESKLEEAKAINGLRAVFDEVLYYS